MIGFLPSPLDSESSSVNNEFVEGLFSSRFSRLPRGKLDESALLPLDYGNGSDFTKLVEVTPAMTQIRDHHTQNSEIKILQHSKIYKVSRNNNIRLWL